MSRPLLLLARAEACAAALGGRLELAASADGPAGFDLLACGEASAEALRLAAERGEAVGALVLAAPRLPAGPATAARWSALKLPSLVLYGTRDREMPADAAHRWRAVLPGCHFMLVYDAGPDIAADRPQAFADIVVDFLGNPGSFLVNRQDGAIDR